MTDNKERLRKELRTACNAIPSAERTLAAQRLAKNAHQLEFFQNCKHIAAYWPHDHEISTLPLITSLLAEHKNCYLPVLRLDAKQQLAFASYTLDTPMVENRYGILEPELGVAYVTTLTELDLIFVPLVGFDSHGQRLGRGGGFYDATFANLHQIPKNKWPLLVGLAYSCQMVRQLPADNWDWQLNAVVTDAEVFNF